MERERRLAAVHVVIMTCGVLRGFDAKYVNTTEGRRLLLVSADGRAPYRTSVALVEHYDGPAVAAALRADFEANGAPLVWRRDRALAHACADVQTVLDDHGVLSLWGPPRYPRYYGQLERQNREHEAWLSHVGLVPPDQLAALCQHEMLPALNELTPRRTLDWKTAAAVWKERPVVTTDRAELRCEVEARTARLLEHDVSMDLAQRLAIEQALIGRGLLRTEKGTWC